ncbi:MAG TPA: hypothetical protein VGJ05_06105 [Fimbriiglobus sp.]|jgi:hypothetical protein
MKAWAVHPVFVAALVTGINALKPVAVDDTAYLLLARQIADHPLDPYGGELFWYAEPVPAFQVLAPPVLPYWLAAGIRLFGEQVPLLKLWLFPFPLLLCFSVRALARKFSPRYSAVSVPAVALSPLILPLFGVMLDVPACSLGLAALAVFIRGGRISWLFAGLLAGLAIETKYTAFVIPAVLLWYGVNYRRILPAIQAALTAVLVFEIWEVLMIFQYHDSHFLYHATAQTTGGPHGWELVDSRWNKLAAPFLNYSGGLGFGLALFAASVIGRKWWVGRSVILLSLLGLAVVGLPYSSTVIWADATRGTVRLDLAGLLFTILGVFWLAVLGWMGILFQFRKRPTRTTMFLTGWLLLEFVSYFVLTPFPAGRRVIGMGVAAAFVFFRAADVLGRIWSVRPARWVLPYGIALGLGLFATDAWDARPEKELAIEAAQFVRERDAGGTAWFNGHWGFQYYCDREGMVPVVPGQSRLRKGDWLVFPAIPDDTGFYRPFHGGAKFRLDPDYLERKIEFVWLDALSAQTIPELYGGRYPFIGRDHPRLRVVVYRVRRDWVPDKAK